MAKKIQGRPLWLCKMSIAQFFINCEENGFVPTNDAVYIINDKYCFVDTEDVVNFAKDIRELADTMKSQRTNYIYSEGYHLFKADLAANRVEFDPLVQFKMLFENLDSIVESA